jgi:predicted CXXCH cytochrome family protein
MRVGSAIGSALLASAILGWPMPADAQPSATDHCAACHLETGDDRLAQPAKDFAAADIHAAKGFGCVACHGGDAKATGMEAMDPAKGYIGKPARRQVAQVCGRCHSDAQFMRRYNPALRVDQVAEYASSGHGRRLAQRDDPRVATCVSCHSAHTIRPPAHPDSRVHPLKVADTCGSCHADRRLMAGATIATDQLEKYKSSVHWKTMTAKGDLSAPTCNDCHGNHGAAPPGISWVGNVCGQCHTVMGELFAKSVHAKVFADLGVPGCATCHDNHGVQEAGDQLLGLEAPAACAACHTADDKGGKSASEMRRLIDSLRQDHERALMILTAAEHAGMEVSQARFELNGAMDALVKARAAVHAFRVEAVKTDTEAGLGIAAKAAARGRRALDELRFRRQGLAVSAVIIVALIVGLVLKIRQLERGREAPRPEGRGGTA